jgi:4-hydroxybenzoate polyprenyltransferase
VAGANIILATASNRKPAEAIARHLGCFAQVLASDSRQNLKGLHKLTAIREEQARLGADGFDYAGDCEADVPILKEARQGYIFSHSKRWEASCRARIPSVQVIGHRAPRVKDYLRLLRPHQWSKNLLLLIPLALSHRWTEPALVFQVAQAMVAFSLGASAVYVLNDFVDLERDRRHASKYRRPLASGVIPIWQAPFLALGLLGFSLTAGFIVLGHSFALILLAYFGANGLYSFWLKNKPMIDVVLLTLMYAVRILAGGVAAGLPVTDWLLSFGLFFFLSLALGKRYQELMGAKEEGDTIRKIRGYQVGDLGVVGTTGMGAALVSVLVMALYIRSPEVVELYRTPRLLWLICPLILYWVGRFWILTGRGEMHDDPIVFALKDRISYIIGACVAVLILVAHGFGFEI